MLVAAGLPPIGEVRWRCAGLRLHFKALAEDRVIRCSQPTTLNTPKLPAKSMLTLNCLRMARPFDAQVARGIVPQDQVVLHPNGAPAWCPRLSAAYRTTLAQPAR